MDDSTFTADFNPNSPEYISQRGEEIYLNELKDKLEANHMGEYAVIDIDTKKVFTNQNLLTALQEAEAEFPNKLFYIVRVGSLQKLHKTMRYDWLSRK